MTRQMCWIPDRRDPRRMILHLREYAHQPWQPYTTSKYAVPDYRIPGGSKGWATFQHLRQAGWTLIATADANKPVVSPQYIAPKAA